MQVTEHPNEQWPKHTNIFFMLCQKKKKKVEQLAIKDYYENSTKLSETQRLKPFQVQAAKPRFLLAWYQMF